MNQSSTSVPTWFKVVMVFLILWNIMGLLSFYMHVFISKSLAALPENERALYGQYPLWTEVVFGISVIGGFIGSIGLLMLKNGPKLLLVSH